MHHYPSDAVLMQTGLIQTRFWVFASNTFKAKATINTPTALGLNSPQKKALLDG